jgi:hypothetical protein
MTTPNLTASQGRRYDKRPRSCVSLSIVSMMYIHAQFQYFLSIPPSYPILAATPKSLRKDHECHSIDDHRVWHRDLELKKG